MEKFFKVLILLGIIVAVILSVQKYNIESSNNTVELVMDYNAFKEHEQEDLSSWKELGISSVALDMVSLEDLEDRGDLLIIEGSELQFYQYFTDMNLKNSEVPVKKDNLYLVIINDDMRPMILDRLAGGIVGVEEEFGEVEIYDDIIVVSHEDRELVGFPLFYYNEEFLLVEEKGLSLVPRVSDESTVEKFIEATENLPEFQKIIFSGEEIVGYPGELDLLAGYMIENEILYGFIEPFIARQEGSNLLAGFKNYDNMVRVHSVVEDDLDFMGVEEAVDRYLRAVEERNVRSLYIKPFTEEEDTREFVSNLSSSLNESGYQIGDSNSFDFISGVVMYRYAIMIALTAFISFFAGKFNKKLSLPLFVLGILVLAFSYFMKLNIIYALAALGVALPVPLWIFYNLMERIQKPGSGNFKNIFSLFGIGILLAFVAGISIQGLLFDNSYLLQANMFRGVKFSFVFPLLIAFFYLFYSKFSSMKKLFNRVVEILNRPLLVKQLLIGLIIIALGSFFIMRTGNEPLVAVSEFELAARGLLEEIFQVRPRFKSFLFGYPILLFGIYLSFRDFRYFWLLVLGLLGPINTINSFTHIHTPFMISFMRELSGALLGFIIGLILIYIHKRWTTYDKKNYLFRLLRLR